MKNNLKKIAQKWIFTVFWLLRIFCTWKNDLPDHQQLQGERFNCGEEGFKTSKRTRGVSYGMVSPPVQSSILAAGGCECICTHSEGENVWTTAWCQEGQQKSHFSPRKTSRTDWNSAGRTRIGQQKTWVLCRANSGASWDHLCVRLLLIQGSGLTHDSVQKRATKNPGAIWWRYIFQHDGAHLNEQARRPLHWNFGSVARKLPDLNPIENLRSILKKRVDKQKPTHYDQLWALIRQEWIVAIRQDLAKKLIPSMPERIAEVIKKKGQHCKYSLFVKFDVFANKSHWNLWNAYNCSSVYYRKLMEKLSKNTEAAKFAKHNICVTAKTFNKDCTAKVWAPQSKICILLLFISWILKSIST